MTKFAIFLTTTLAAGFFCMKVTDTQPDARSNVWQDEEEIQERLVTYRCFKDTLLATVEDLGSGAIRLKEAHARVMTAARSFHPDYFEFMKTAETGNTNEERLANNLVAHVRNLEEFDAKVTPRLATLDAELRELLEEFRTQESAH